MRPLSEDDARHRISARKTPTADAREILNGKRSMTSTQRLPSPTRPQRTTSPSSSDSSEPPRTSPLTRSPSPAATPRRPNARSQAQRARLDADFERLRAAVRDREAGIENENTARLTSTQVVFTSDSLRQQFLTDLENGGRPSGVLRAVLDAVEDDEIDEIEEIRIPRAGQRSSRDPRRNSRHPSPPPSYSEAMASDPRSD